MTLQEQLEELKITAEKFFKRINPSDGFPVYSADFNHLIDTLKNIQDIEVIDPDIVVQNIEENDLTHSPSGDAVFTALENKQDILTTSSIEDSTWDLSGAAKQSIILDTNKELTLINFTDSTKMLIIIHGSSTHTLTIGDKIFSIVGSTSKISIIIATVVGGDLFISDSVVYDKFQESSAEFPLTNRIGLWKMDGIVNSGGFATSWVDDDGNASNTFVKFGADGPIYDAINGITFTNNQNMNCNAGILLGTAFTAYALIKKTGATAGLFSNFDTNTYFLYSDNSSILFNSYNYATSVINNTPLGIMSDYKVLAISFAGGGSSPIIYLDGLIIGSFSVSSETDPSKLYRLSANGSDIFNGYIKGFSFFNTVHSSLEIATNSPLFKILVES